MAIICWFDKPAQRDVAVDMNLCMDMQKAANDAVVLA